MPASRYSNDSRIGLGRQLGSNRVVRALRESIAAGTVPIVSTLVATGDDRLDTLAGTIYGDSRYWWVLAAASNIGWGLQIPPGTVINVLSLTDVERFLG